MENLSSEDLLEILIYLHRFHNKDDAKHVAILLDNNEFKGIVVYDEMIDDYFDFREIYFWKSRIGKILLERDEEDLLNRDWDELQHSTSNCPTLFPATPLEDGLTFMDYYDVKFIDDK